MAFFQQCGAGGFLLREGLSLDDHGTKTIYIGSCVFISVRNVLSIPLNHLLRFLDLSWIAVGDVMLQGVDLAQMISLQELQLGNGYIQVHFLLHGRVPGTEGLDLRIGKGGLVNVFGRTDRRLAGHDLPDELLLGFHQMIKVGVEGVLCDVGVDFNLRVLVSLTNDPPFPLLKICGSYFADKS